MYKNRTYFRLYWRQYTQIVLIFPSTYSCNPYWLLCWIYHCYFFRCQILSQVLLPRPLRLAMLKVRCTSGMLPVHQKSKMPYSKVWTFSPQHPSTFSPDWCSCGKFNVIIPNPVNNHSFPFYQHLRGDLLEQLNHRLDDLFDTFINEVEQIEQDPQQSNGGIGSQIKKWVTGRQLPMLVIFILQR